MDVFFLEVVAMVWIVFCWVLKTMFSFFGVYAYHKVVCPLGFACQLSLIMLSAHCAHGFDHIVLYFAAHHESSVPVVFCIPNLFADCFSIMLLTHCAHGFGHIVLLCCPS